MHYFGLLIFRKHYSDHKNSLFRHLIFQNSTVFAVFFYDLKYFGGTGSAFLRDFTEVILRNFTEVKKA